MVLIFLCCLIFLIWTYLQLTTYRKCNSKVCLIGKTALITGGNKGIGFQTSLGLASRGCRVIIACRSDAEKEKEKIIKLSNNKHIVTKKLDLSSLKSVRQLAQELNETEEKLDILINNAGMSDINSYTEDGLQPAMQINYFGPFLLTHLLVDLLKKSKNGRILFISSLAACLSNLTMENLNYPEKVEKNITNGMEVYSNSKLCQIIASNIFAEKLERYNITSNCLHPGTVNTDIFRHATVVSSPIRMAIFYFIAGLFFKTPEEGAQLTLKLAISNSYKNKTGTFLWHVPWMRLPKCLKDKEFCRQIWEASEKYVHLKENEKI